MEVTKLVDQVGWPIVVGARVRINCGAEGKQPIYKNGEVIKVDEEKKTVDIREFKNHGIATTTTDRVKVMRGKTRKSFEYELVKAKFRRGKK